MINRQAVVKFSLSAHGYSLAYIRHDCLMFLLTALTHATSWEAAAYLGIMSATYFQIQIHSYKDCGLESQVY